MFEKKCSKCDAPATVQLNLVDYCSEHARERVVRK